MTFTLTNESGEPQFFKQEWTLRKLSVDEFSLLYAWGGDPMPRTVKGTKNTDYLAVKKQHGKDSFKIFPDKIVDICKYVIDAFIEDERQMLIADFRRAGVLGYLLGEITMLIDLQQSDFEEVFDAGLQPIAVVYDERATRHEVVFKDGSKPDGIKKSGRVRFLKTPEPLVRVYHGEIRKRINMQNVTELNSDSGVVDGCSAEKLSQRRKTSGGDMDSKPNLEGGESSIDPPGQVAGCGTNPPDTTDLSSKHELNAHLKYWAFINACKLVLDEKREHMADGSPLFKTQSELIEDAEKRLQEVLKIEDFKMSESRRKKQLKDAVAAGHLPDYKTGKLKSKN